MIVRDLLFTERVALHIAEFHASEKDEEGLMQVLSGLEKSLKANNQQNLDILSKISAYEVMQNIYKKYEDSFQKAKKASKRLLQEIRQLYFNYEKVWMKLPFKIAIENKSINNHLVSIFDNNGNNNLEMVMNKIAISHLPKKIIYARMLYESPSKHLNPLLSHRTFPNDDITISKFSSKNESGANRLKLHILQQFGFLPSGQLLPFAIDELIKRFSNKEIIGHFENSMLYVSKYGDYLKEGIQAYLDKSYKISLNLFITFIEIELREFVVICGGSVWKGKKSVERDRKGLKALLCEKKVIEVFSRSDLDIMPYFKWVLTEKRGLNYRNNFAHSLELEELQQRHCSDRLLHILIFLSLVKKQKDVRELSFC